MSGTACFVQITAQYAKEYDGRRKSYAIKRERERKQERKRKPTDLKKKVHRTGKCETVQRAFAVIASFSSSLLHPLLFHFWGRGFFYHGQFGFNMIQWLIHGWLLAHSSNYRPTHSFFHRSVDDNISAESLHSTPR